MKIDAIRLGIALGNICKDINSDNAGSYYYVKFRRVSSPSFSLVDNAHLSAVHVHSEITGRRQVVLIILIPAH